MYKSDSVWKKTQKMKSLLSFRCTIRPHDPFSLAVDDGQNNGTPLSCYIPLQYTWVYIIILWIYACMEKMGALTLGTIPTYILVKWGEGGFL